MNLLILPGNSPKHREWLVEAKTFFSQYFDNVVTLNYSHWDNGGEIDLNLEAERVKQLVKDLPEFVIFAKSIGTILTMKGVCERILSPAKVVFAGFPIELLKESIGKEINTWFEKYVVLTTIIQKTDDPLGSAKAVREYISKFNKENLEAVEIPGDDHVYDDFELTKKYLI